MSTIEFVPLESLAKQNLKAGFRATKVAGRICLKALRRWLEKSAKASPCLALQLAVLSLYVCGVGMCVSVALGGVELANILQPQIVAGKSDPLRIARVALESAKKHGVDPKLSTAVLWVESRGNKKALSHKGAVGLMQVMPFNAKFCGLNEKELEDPIKNIDCGHRILAEAVRRYGERNGVKVYNGGPKCLRLKCAETETYVRNVLHYRDFLQTLSKEI